MMMVVVVVVVVVVGVVVVVVVDAFVAAVIIVIEVVDVVSRTITSYWHFKKGFSISFLRETRDIWRNHFYRVSDYKKLYRRFMRQLGKLADNVPKKKAIPQQTAAPNQKAISEATVHISDDSESNDEK